MDPRYQALKKRGHFSTGRIIAIYFRVGRDNGVKVSRPSVFDVTKQGPYLNGRSVGMEFFGLEEYDEATGLLYKEERGIADGVFTLAMVGAKETPEAAMTRLATVPRPDIQTLWRQIKRQKQVEKLALDAALAGGVARKLTDLGADPAQTRFIDEEDTDGGKGLPMP